MDSKVVVWALFDSGNGCYYQVSKEFEEIEIYSVGLDIENKNSHFINCDLGRLHLFGENEVYKTLDKLPRPDLIIASPPCESWSQASAMANGNACWKREEGDCFFRPRVPFSNFTIRDYKDYSKYQYDPVKQFSKRINGELCTFNLVQIIKKYQPKYYIIENPATSRIWEYIEKILGFEIPYDNFTRYNNYDNYPTQKPTKFKGNIELNLKKDKKANKIPFNNLNGYNNRSNIPISLVKEIFRKILEIEI